ncbi:MAG: PH domain-containing protein [Anaerolineales bacterium]
MVALLVDETACSGRFLWYKLPTVNEEQIFHPARRMGYIFHFVAIALLIAGGIWGVWQAVHTDVGPKFLLYLSPALLTISFVPLLMYRVYALRNARYALNREAFRLQWGLRVELIPMRAVEWVGSSADLHGTLRLPLLRWPGSVLGRGELPDGRSIEFLASRGRNLILIATQNQVFAVSPEEPDQFTHAYQRLTELGSLAPLEAQSSYPAFLLVRFWQARPARYITLTGVLLSLGLLAWVSLSIPKYDQISLGFNPEGAPRVPIPGVRLLLLPLLNTFYFIFNLFVGLYFFRREESQPLAYLLWITSALVACLFLVAVYFILRAQ